jgi:hypothetical protein
MTQRARAAMAAAALLIGSATMAAEDPGVLKELTAVIEGQQLSCGKVVHFDAQADRDYLVHCQDGSIYQVSAGPQGKLVATLIAKKVQQVK